MEAGPVIGRTVTSVLSGTIWALLPFTPVWPRT